MNTEKNQNNAEEIDQASSGLHLEPVSFSESYDINPPSPSASSRLSKSGSLQYAQLVDLTEGEGSVIFYPKRVNLEVGDVLFFRERPSSNLAGELDALDSDENLGQRNESGVVVQVIALGTASYPQVITKALFRLMVNVRASVMGRSHNEPPEVIDEFLLATVKVRASIVDGEWSPPEGRVVTRNVDIFVLDPSLLAQEIFEKIEDLNLYLGDYKGEPVEFFGGGFEKINLITGMKGTGKSHIAKGIINESVQAGMSAVVFDINNEYGGLPQAYHFSPGQNLRFRLDRVRSRTFIEMVERLAPFAERTALLARANLPRVIRARIDQRYVPDLEYLRNQANNVIPGNASYINNMRSSYQSSLRIVDAYDLIMTQEQASAEDQFINNLHRGEGAEPPDIVSLRSVLYNMVEVNDAGVIVFEIGGLQPFVQFSVVDLIIDTLKETSRLQTEAYHSGEIAFPNYPTIYFEEAHMYMESAVIDELLPLIRHHGMNVFFITNTPGALPDSVFRLMDNLVMTRMLNRRDIDQVKNCGLTDAETIQGFAGNLPKYHALLLSGVNGTTRNFPLVFGVRDFGLPASGVTRSMWRAMKDSSLDETTE